ncbi:MAG: pilus assembly protein PilM [Butyrivibrio sp.]|nr:pilus assembly protein PilM [Butyrivibrio sp.]
MASRVITIIIGNDVTRISDVAYSAQKSINVYAAATVPTPASAVEDGMVTDIPLMAKTIKEGMDVSGISGKNVIFSIQSSKVASKEVITPELKDNKLRDFINTNATEYFPVNIEDYVIAFSALETILEEEVRKTRVMVAVAPVAMVEAYYSLAEMLDMHIESIDYVGNSTLQFIRYQVSEVPSIVIQMTEENTFVTILNRNVLQLMRTVPYGKSTIANALVDKRDITYEEAVAAMADTHNALKSSFAEGDYVTDSLKYLVNNISRVMDYYTQKNAEYPIEKAYILVEGSPVYGIEKLFSFELNITVEKLETVQMAPASGNEITDMSTYIPNIGAVIAPVNFLPQSVLDKAKKSNSNKYFRVALLAAVLIALLLVSFPLMQYWSKSSDKSDLEQRIKNIEYVQEIVDQYYIAKDKYSDMAAFNAMAFSYDDYLSEFIEYLEENMPSDISVTAMTIANGGVTMSLTARSKETIAAFIVALDESVEKDGINIGGVYVPAISESVDAEGVITASCTLSCVFVPTAEELLTAPGVMEDILNSLLGVEDTKPEETTASEETEAE